MFVYEKKLQYPVNIKQPNPKLAKLIITQYGGAYFCMLYFIRKANKIRICGTCLLKLYFSCFTATQY